MFNFFGITFHTYGLIVGLAVVTGLQLIEHRFKQIKNPPCTESQLWKTILIVIVFGILGARIWHVVTDWQLYKYEPHLALYIWNGGISIIGAILGGMVGTYFAAHVLHFSDFKKSVGTVLDLSIFGLPIAQAIGRFGNFVNQELYGLPTSLPWGIFIDKEHRVAGFEQFSSFHPLFAYEALLTAGFGLVIWFLFLKKKKADWVQLGEGKLALMYVVYYSLVRFLLEFLRIEKSLFMQTQLGINQVILFIIGVLAILFLGKINYLNVGAKKV